MKCKNIFKTIIGISGFLGLALAATGNAWAGGCFSDSSYVISAANIGSKTSCQDYASNDPGITGCEIPEGGTSCSVTVNDCTITINRSDFDDGVTRTTTFYTVDTSCGAVVTALGFGQQQGSYCAYGLFHSPGALATPGVTVRNTDNRGNDTAIRDMEFCVTDNAFTVGAPLLNVDKRVTTYAEDENGDPVWDCTISSDELTIPAISPSGDTGDATPPNSTVIYCAYVSNTGTAPIEGVSLVDDKADPAGDLLFFGYEDGTTKDGGPASFDLEIGERILVVYTGIITEPVVNTATVAASGISASDTAEVLVAVTCNDLTEDLADDSTMNTPLGALVTTYTADGTATCAPDGTLSLVCDMAPDDGSHSGNWCYDESGVAMCTDCEPTPGNPPFCREVWAHPDNECDGTGVPPIENDYLTQNTVLVGQINPTVMTFCGSGGGSGTCTIYCFTDGTASDRAFCPPGSLVY